MRSENPPAAPPRPRTQSPVSPASHISRSIPAVPIRNPVTSPTKPKVATPERAPPPPPRSSHVVAPSPVRTAPAPPGRKQPSAAIAAAYVDSAARTYSPEPDSSNVRAISHFPPPSRRPLASTNGDKLLARRKSKHAFIFHTSIVYKISLSTIAASECWDTHISSHWLPFSTRFRKN